MNIAFSNDHAAVAERGALVAELKSLGHEVLDFGVLTPESVDYPDVEKPALEALISGAAERAVLVCGSGVGMSIVANRVPGVRCALATDLYAAEMSRRHNDANCLALRSREQAPEMNAKILELWLSTTFEGGRHERRVEKIETVAQGILAGD